MKNLQRILLGCLMIASFREVNGQPLVSQSVLAAAGLNTQQSSLVISSTLGETFIFGGQQSPLSVCEGFQSGIESGITDVVHIGSKPVSITYYPNPTKDDLIIEWDSPGDYTIQLFTMDGQLLINQDHQQSLAKAIFHLNGMSPGTYVLTFSTSAHRYVYVGKIIYQP